MKRYSKRNREDAAVFCAARSAWWALHGHAPDTAEMGREFFRPLTDGAEDLASAAYFYVPYDHAHGEEWAEAEALIRTGWSPK